jgi:hypothetical protein
VKKKIQFPLPWLCTKFDAWIKPAEMDAKLPIQRQLIIGHRRRIPLEKKRKKEESNINIPRAVLFLLTWRSLLKHHVYMTKTFKISINYKELTMITATKDRKRCIIKPLSPLIIIKKGTRDSNSLHPTINLQPSEDPCSAHWFLHGIHWFFLLPK